MTNAADVSPDPVTGTTASLSVLGADDGGEGALTYTWATTGTPPAAVGFSPNGNNAAKNSTATFTKAGSYDFREAIRDAGALSVTLSVSVSVNQTLTTIAVTPLSTSVATNAATQFTATAKDQFWNGAGEPAPFLVERVGWRKYRRILEVCSRRDRARAVRTR